MLLNNVTFAGNLGRDAESFSTADGKLIVTLSVAHTQKVKEKEYVTWARVKVFEPWSNTAKNYMKGDNIVISGALTTSEWTDKKSGEKRTSLEIKAHSLGKCNRDAAKKEKPDLSAPFDASTPSHLDSLPF